MIDQSHNVTDPIESLILSTNEILNAYAKSLLIDHEHLKFLQKHNDVIGASCLLKDAFNTDVRSLLKQVRLESYNAIDPIFTYRQLNYKKEKSQTRINKKKVTFVYFNLSYIFYFFQPKNQTIFSIFIFFIFKNF